MSWFWWGLAFKCGYPHPDLLWSVLTERQRVEIELFAKSHAINEVSEPKPQPKQGMFESIAEIMGVKAKKE